MDRVLLDVVQDKVSKLIARDEYGVVIVDTEDGPNVDEKATNILRKKIRKTRSETGEMIDRGPGMRLFE
jgi:vacuolar-type H+-ATPase subunit F/Vma7